MEHHEGDLPTGDNQIADDLINDPPPGQFRWKIANFSRIPGRLCSDYFYVGGYKWQLLMFPHGQGDDKLAMYLVNVSDSTTLYCGWNTYTQFILIVVNQINKENSIRDEMLHQFGAGVNDWGKRGLIPLADLYDPIRGFLVNDTCIVGVDIIVRKVLDDRPHDSKRETGYVGLKNQGATCYLNSLLQTLYHIPIFRKAVYNMPTTDNDMPTGSIPLALQSLFYKLQYSDKSVATEDLTKSFGWNIRDSFLQNDVQELSRVLCLTLENKMRGNVVEGTIKFLFEGHYKSYIECINVDYKSAKKESFYDLQLEVKGCQNVYDSLDKYVEVEKLEGDNKYYARSCGLQEAYKSVLFIDFPPVLQLQLKRFKYDCTNGTMEKINDYYEFPLQLDLDRDNGKYLSLEADRRICNLYTLHSVLVHSGGVDSGHYYAYIRPTKSDQWFKFDDERVTKEDAKRALEEQYGGEEEFPHANPLFDNSPIKFTKYSNAYVLVYIRDSDKDNIICNVDDKNVALYNRNEQKDNEQQKREKAEAHLYTIIKVARAEDMFEQIGKDIFFDLVDHDKLQSFRINRNIPFSFFQNEVARVYCIPVSCQRFWLWAKRQNHTYRPDRPLSPYEETISVGQLSKISNGGYNAELKLFLEVEIKRDFRFLPPPKKTKDDLLLFFKLYDPSHEKLRYVGKFYVKASGMPLDILTRLNQMARFAVDEVIKLFEEIRFEPCVMCERVEMNSTFLENQLEDGDIICYQKDLKAGNVEQFRYPDVPSFLEYVHNRQFVRFRMLENPQEDEFSLELSKLHTYDDVVIRVAQRIGLVDPSRIRLTSHNCFRQQPQSQPIKYQGFKHLSDLLIQFNQICGILYYEILDIPLPELQHLETLTIAFHLATKDEVVIYTIRLPKRSSVEDVINELKSKVDLSHPDAQLRLLGIFNHTIYKIFCLSEKIENIKDQHWMLRAEEIPKEEKNLGPNDRLIRVYHFMKATGQSQQIQNFGDPFFYVIHEGETLAAFKLRIQKRLKIPDEEFSKWKFAFVFLGHPEYYIQDSDIISTKFQRRVIYGDWEQYIGLEHTDSAPEQNAPKPLTRTVTHLTF